MYSQMVDVFNQIDTTLYVDFIDVIAHHCWVIPIFVLAVISWYNLFCVPFSTSKDFSDFGFEQAENFSSTTKKKIIINEMNRRRKVGDIPPVYPNGWFVIFESDKIKCGQSKELYILGQNLVIWRGSSGVVYVADAYCPHLGAHLGIGGEVNQECIRCPFHAWEFDGTNGNVSKIPYTSTAVEKFTSAKLDMKTIVEHCGYIYMHFNAEGDKPTWFPDEIPEIKNGLWKYRGRSDFLVTAILQDIQENGADVSHFNALHEPSVFSGATPWKYWWHSAITKYFFVTEWKAYTEKTLTHKAAFEMTARVRLFDLATIFKMSVRVIQVGPATARMELDTVIGKGVLMISITPIEPMLQKIVHRFYTSSTFIAPFAQFLLHMYDVMLCRDIVVWNRKTFLKNPVLASEDSTIRHYRKWFSQFYSKNSTLYSHKSKPPAIEL